MVEENNSVTARREGLKARSLLYHDVVDAGQDDSSGFSGPAAAHYKLTWPEFEQHLEAMHGVLTAPVTTITELLAADGPAHGFVLAFDDGGTSSMRIADVIERYDWRGHFFISTDYISQPGFMRPAQISELHRRGHVIGSHSCSHPLRMSACSPAEMVREWKQSGEILSQILGEKITAASVPGGNYSRRVAEAAAEVGIKALFTSEPTTRVRNVGECLVLGRYGVVRGMSPAAAAGLALGKFLPCTRQLLSWKLKMTLKIIGGSYYDRFRDLCFGELSKSGIVRTS